MTQGSNHFLILDQCNRAIIDVSHPRGQYLEIEHILSMPQQDRINMKIISQNKSSVSGMLKSCEPQIYLTMDELKKMIREWLQRGA